MKNKSPKDCNCKGCNKEMTKSYYNKYDGNCVPCDQKQNPSKWGVVEMFSIIVTNK